MDPITREHTALAASCRDTTITFTPHGIQVIDPVDRYGLAHAILQEPITHTITDDVEALTGLSRVTKAPVTVYGPTGQ